MGIYVSNKDKIIGVLALMITIGLIIAALVNRENLVDVERIAGYSLAGVFVIALVASSLISLTLIPIPYYLVAFLLSNTLALEWGVLAPVVVGTVSAVGATLGQAPTFYIGFKGKELSYKIVSKFDSKRYRQGVYWARRGGSLTAFLISAIMNPIHLPVTIALGTLKFPPIKWAVLTLAGNMTKNLVLAFAGFYSIDLF
jgi:membrane protein DedA with SNARE-associated domain